MELDQIKERDLKPFTRDFHGRRRYDDDHRGAHSEPEPLSHFDSESMSMSSSSLSSSSSSLSSFSDEEPYIDDHGTGFEILKPGPGDIEDFYNETD